jgi:glucarate dehydratase
MGKVGSSMRPGVGVSIDRDKLARVHETWQKCGMAACDDAFTMWLIEPNWQRETRACGWA